MRKAGHCLAGPHLCVPSYRPSLPLSTFFSLSQTRSSVARTTKVVMFHRYMLARICAAALVCSGGEVLAQTIYKQIDGAGRTTFSDRPAASSVSPYETSRRQEGSPLSPPRIGNGNRSDGANALASNSAMSSIYAATIDFNEATRRLRQARDTRQDGMEPRGGEWRDSAVTSAMAERYQRRQQRLERAVVTAERRAHETSVLRDTLLMRAVGRLSECTPYPPDPTRAARPAPRGAG